MNADYFDALAFAMKVKQEHNKSKIVAERTFIKMTVRRDLNTIQKMIVFKFITNLDKS